MEIVRFELHKILASKITEKISIILNGANIGIYNISCTVGFIIVANVIPLYVGFQLYFYCRFKYSRHNV